MYDPQVGRFLEEDVLGFAAGDANLYRYVGNSPTNATDPSGLVSSVELIGYGTPPDWVIPEEQRKPDPDRDEHSETRIGFYQTRGSRGDIGAGRWSQPDRAGSGNYGMIGDKKYPYGAAYSQVSIEGRDTEGGVCNTPISKVSDLNPDKAMAGSLRVDFRYFPFGKYKITFTWNVTITTEPGSVSATVNVHVNKDGDWTNVAAYSLDGNSTIRRTIERSGGNYSVTYTSDKATKNNGLIRIVPVVAGQKTGKATVRVMVGIINIEKA